MGLKMVTTDRRAQDDGAAGTRTVGEVEPTEQRTIRWAEPNGRRWHLVTSLCAAVEITTR
jgi:hypothetical protein